MSFEVGKAYERRPDKMTAVVTETYETGQIALLRLANDEVEQIRAVDVPTHWRLYEICPECLGTGKFFTKLTSSDCPMCKGSRRIYP